MIGAIGDGYLMIVAMGGGAPGWSGGLGQGWRAAPGGRLSGMSPEPGGRLSGTSPEPAAALGGAAVRGDRGDGWDRGRPVNIVVGDRW
jgi:hypothetical protein